MLVIDLLYRLYLFFNEKLVHVLVDFGYIHVNMILDKKLNTVHEKVGPVNIDANFFEGSQVKDWFVAIQEIPPIIDYFSRDQ